MVEEKFRFNLRGKTCVFIDWANVYGWKKSLKKEVNPKKLYKYLKSYKEIQFIGLYHGTDKNEQSRKFLKSMKAAGYTVSTKPVKYIRIAEVQGKKLYRRKCDFDMEICIDVHEMIRKDFQSFIFFTGDGDFEPLYKLLIGQKKQVIVVYAHGHLGREIWNIKKGIYKKAIDTLEAEVF